MDRSEIFKILDNYELKYNDTKGASLASIADSVDEYDFKHFKWGDSVERVVESEGDDYTERVVHGMNSTYIVYETTVAGISAMLAYYFSE